MTAAAHSSNSGQGTQQWQRTVYLRQGRFFVISVTVRTFNDLPLRSAYPKVYTTGRFTVREELQWVRQHGQDADNPVSLCDTYSCKAAARLVECEQWRRQALKQLQQVWESACSGSCAFDTQLAQEQQEREQEEEQEQRPCVPAQDLCAAVAQQGPEASTPQPRRSWWSRLLSSHRFVPGADTALLAPAHPALDSAVRVTCLQLGFSWGCNLRRTLSSLASRLGMARVHLFFHRVQDSSSPADSEQGPDQTLPAAQGDADGSLEPSTKAAHEDLQQKAVHIEVIGYACGDVLGVAVPA